MSELLMLYCGFMWLLTLGIVGSAFYDTGRKLSATEITGAIINLMFAPLLTPIVLGHLIYNN